MTSICVFLGSRPGAHPSYLASTVALGRELAKHNLTCVYGGSSTGLMKALADSVLEYGGQVVGVTVQTLKDKEQFHTGLTTLHVAPTMAQRKALMMDLADGFIALPGGVGTYDELFEVCALRQLGYHAKPCGLLDINGFYNPLQLMLAKAEQEGFLHHSHRKNMFISSDPAQLIAQLLTHAQKA